MVTSHAFTRSVAEAAADALLCEAEDSASEENFLRIAIDYLTVELERLVTDTPNERW